MSLHFLCNLMRAGSFLSHFSQQHIKDVPFMSDIFPLAITFAFQWHHINCSFKHCFVFLFFQQLKGKKYDSNSWARLVYIDDFIWCIYKQAHAGGGQWLTLEGHSTKCNSKTQGEVYRLHDTSERKRGEGGTVPIVTHTHASESAGGAAYT